MQEQFEIDNNTIYFPHKIEAAILPKLTEAFKNISNQWYRNQSSLELKIGSLNFQVSPKYSRFDESKFQNYFFFLTIQNTDNLICIDKRFISLLLETLYEEINFDKLSVADQVLILEFLFSPILETFEKSYGAPAVITPCEDHVQYNHEEILAGNIDIHGIDESFPFYISITPETAQLYEKLPKQQKGYDSQNIRQLANSIYIPVTINYGCIEIDLGTVKNLDTGDIVLVGSGLEEQNRLDIRVGNLSWIGTRTGEQGHIKLLDLNRNALHRVNSVNYNKDDNNMSERNDGASIDDISVTVAFEVGRKEISLGQLTDLQEGSVLSFPDDEKKEIHIVVNGKEVGWGSLVRVGDDIGVKIERIFVNG